MIRPARASDAAQILDLLNPILRHTTISFTTLEKTTDDINAALDEHAQNNWPYLISHTNKVTGVASYAPFRKGPGYARTMEHTIYVAPSAHKTGIGRLLMTALEKHAAAHGVTTLIGAISGENTAGLAFHQRMGFVQAGHLSSVGHKFGRDLDLILMQKTLVTDRIAST